MNPIIRLLLTIDGFRIFALGLLGPIYAIFIEKIGGDILDVGLAFAIYSITLGVIAYFVGRAGDKFINPLKLMFLGYLLYAVSFYIYIFVRTPAQFMITQVILGVAGAFSAPTFDAFFSTHLDRKKSNTEWADWEAENFVLTGIAALIGAAIAKFLGFKILFFVMGTSLLFSLFYIYLIYQKSNSKFRWLFKLFRKS